MNIVKKYKSMLALKQHQAKLDQQTEQRFKAAGIELPKHYKQCWLRHDWQVIASIGLDTHYKCTKCNEQKTELKHSCQAL